MHNTLTSSESEQWQVFEKQAADDLQWLMQWRELSASEVSIAFVSPQTIQKLNFEYRQKDKATDVLSVEQNETFGDFYCLGDIIICIDIAESQAKEKKWPLQQEVRLLLVHGFLHLLGYDHTELEEEKIMFALQDQLLQELNKNAL